jgi:hypothetical protein
MFHRNTLSLVTTWTARSPSLSIRGVERPDNRKKLREGESDGGTARKGAGVIIEKTRVNSD